MKKYTIRVMTIEDYDGLHALWMTIHGFGIRSIDDSRVGVERFLRRNPATSVVAVAEDGSKISSSPIAYVTPKGKSYANASKLSVSKKSVSLGAGEKAKVSAKVIRLDSKGKKLLKVSGVKKVRYMSSEPTIVKVTKYGNITALRAGTAYVYAIAADGVYKRIKVTVE